MTYRSMALLAGLAFVGYLVGCSQPTAERHDSATSPSGGVAQGEGARFLLDQEPAGAAAVIQVREEAVDGDEITLVGRIGGSVNPWIAGRAAFSVVDESIKACSDIPGDGCPTPWDYCCQTHLLPTATALVKIVDEHGELVNADAPDLLNVTELSTVVVQGKAERDDAGNLAILARGVFVKKK
jgi:hypothetical protein